MKGKNTKATRQGKDRKDAAPVKVAKPVQKRAGAAQAKAKLSAIDAAAQVLAAEGRPMNTKEMIETMAAQGLWTSPHGKTPAATLYASILREKAGCCRCGCVALGSPYRHGKREEESPCVNQLGSQSVY